MRRIVLLVSLGVAFGASGCEPQNDRRGFGKPRLACSLDVPGLDESSGIAASRSFPNLYYTHNDDDKPMRYWRFRLTGEFQGPFILPNIVNRDVEDMAAATFEGKNYLYFADIGDNKAQWDNVRVYRVIEPTAARGEQRKVDVFTLHYPDSPRNAEAFFVDPNSGAFWIVSKNEKVANVYVCPKPKPGENRLNMVGELKFPGMISAMKLVTGAACSPDGRFVIVRTYTAAYEFAAGDRFDEWFKSPPKKVAIAVEAQGESIGYSLDGQTLITTSEGKPCPVSTLPLQVLP